MRFEIEQRADGSSDLVVLELSEDEARAFEADPEVLVVGLAHDGTVYRRSFPPGTPYLTTTADNLRRFHSAILGQAAGTTVPDWQTALDLVLERLGGSSIEWMLIGGAALAVQDVQVVPADIDLITDVDGAKAMNELFSDRLITPTAPLPDWGYFGRAYAGAKFEWAGNDPGQNPQMWNLGDVHRVVSWRGHEMRVALLDTYLEIERGRGRNDRVAAIEAVLAQRSE